MLKKSTGILVIFAAFELSGCASNASIEQMTYNNNTTEKPNKVALINNISIPTVTGGKETNPLWTSQINNENFKQALEASLQKANLYHMVNGEKYQLTANLLNLDQPFMGLDLKVTLQVHYNLQDKKSNQIIFNKNITSSYTATFSDSPVAITRLKIANEGAARENIQQLIKELYHL